MSDKPDFAYMNEEAREIEREEIARAQLREGNALARDEAKRQGVSDIVERLRIAPMVILDHHQVAQGATIRQMMIERAEAADLIERQAAEIQEYKHSLNTLGDFYDKAQAEIERLRAELNGRLGQPFGDPAKS